MTTTTETRSARAAVAAVFLTNGALFAALVPRLPRVKDDLGLTNAELGAALAAFPLGALVAGLFAAAVIGRLRSGPVAAYGIVLLAAVFFLVALAPSGLLLGVVLFTAGALDAVVDVAQNTHGLRVQRAYGRSIVNSLHGLWSVGAVGAHLGLTGVLFAVVALVASRFLLPGADDRERDAETGGGRWTAVALRMVLPLGVLACCGAVTEDAGA
jgi:MFS family permease